MSSIDVYCGWCRDTIVSIEPCIIDGIVFEIPCLECEGTGIWDYFTEEIPPDQCNVCKGSGRQYIGV